MPNNIDQERAKYAYKKVNEVLPHHSIKDKYSTKAVGFPSMVLTNGLPQSLLFLFSNENATDKSYSILLSHIRGWFVDSQTDSLKLYTCPADNVNTNEAFVEHVISVDSATLQLIAYETVCLANWLKRFAEGMIGKGGQ